ncbi:MAG: UDP-3-O-(3-hydroxymyristoyl)glucosamine N-acyltransferase, partial [Rubellimicrobium sp.]|nr:UDP-3-O-(3-hydroxymyristoyl)glucosamine N-acyltransferase [Rubellimicrobium sp.]
MRYSIAEIAAALGAEAAGDLTLRVGAAAEPAAAGEGDIALALAPAYAGQLAQGRAKAAVVWPGADWQGLGLRAAIFAPRGRLAMARLTGLLALDAGIGPGIHPSAVIDPTAVIGEGVAIGPLAVIGPGAGIGAGCRIGAQVTVG